MKGMVSTIKHAADPRQNEYYVVEGGSGVRLLDSTSKELLNVGEEVDVSGSGISCGNPGAADKDAYLKEVAKIANGIVSGKNLADVPGLGDMTSRMKQKIISAAEVLVKKCMLGVPIVVRFHNDSDGLGGAYAVYKSLEKLFSKKYFDAKPRIAWRMHRSVFYTKEDAISDILAVNEYDSITKPLLVIIDFGTSTESNSGASHARSRFDIIWLDHHQIEKGFEGTSIEHYINPLLYGGDSNYTAGYLASRLARCIGDVDTSSIEQASLIGDYSIYAKPSDESRELAMLFDLVTSDVNVIGAVDNISPAEVDLLLGDAQKRKELMGYAKSRLSESIDLALESVKLYKSAKANIYVVNFENVRAEGSRYPLPGRFASKLLEHIETLSDRPSIVLLYFGAYVSVRVSKAIAEAQYILETVKGMKDNYSAIDSAGGHANAMSIKLKDKDASSTIIRALLKELGAGV